MRDIAINLDKNFASLGSFWLKQFFGKEKEHIRTLSTLGIYNNLHTIRENYKNNLQGIPIQSVTNTRIAISASDIITVNDSNVVKLPFTEKIKIKYIKPINLKADKPIIYIAGIDFVQTKDALEFTLDSSSSGQVIQNLFWDTPELDSKNLTEEEKENILAEFKQRDIEFLINGEYLPGAKEMEYQLKCIVGVDKMPLRFAKYITNYIGGANQSPRHLELAINAMLGCTILDRAGTLDSVVSFKDTLGYSKLKFKEGFTEDIYYPIPSDLKPNTYYKKESIICPFVKIYCLNNDFSNLREVKSNMYYAPPESQKVGKHMLQTLYCTYDIMDEARLRYYNIETTEKLVKNLLPLGWNYTSNG